MQSSIKPIFSGDFRARAEAFFLTDLSKVRICLSTQSALYGAFANTQGETVCLARETLALPQEWRERIIIHELTHVLQQRHGRVKPTHFRYGRFFNDDPSLEEEAWEMGGRFAKGSQSLFPLIQENGTNIPVIQNALTIGGATIQSTTNLSAKAQSVLGLIPSGNQWFGWAIANTNNLFAFQDEPEMLEGVQAGLHGIDNLLLNNCGLLVSPLKLMRLNENDLQVLCNYENPQSGSVSSGAVTSVLTQYGLYSENALAPGRTFLANLGIQDAPVFQTLCLADEIALLQLSDSLGSVSANVQNFASCFALQYAVSPLEFVDYFNFFVSQTQNPGSLLSSTQGKQLTQNITKALTGVQSVLYGMLNCPRVPTILTPSQLNQTLNEWYSLGNIVGFIRLSTGVSQIGASANLMTTTDYQGAVVDYMVKAQKFIKSQVATAVRITQDGQNILYEYSADNSQAVLSMDTAGDVMLQSFSQ